MRRHTEPWVFTINIFQQHYQCILLLYKRTYHITAIQCLPPTTFEVFCGFSYHIETYFDRDKLLPIS